MTTTAPTHEQQAGEFADAVRTHLADLPEPELDELMDGLEADLTERLADSGELGDPERYADELRQAAGLPARADAGATGKKRVRESLRESRINLVQRTRTFWDATPARRATRDFVVSLRPVWWVLRGLVLAWLLVQGWFGSGLLGFLLAVLIIVVSVQWGRGRWAPKTWLVVLRRIASTVAVVLLLPALAFTWNSVASPNYVYIDDPFSYGLIQNGEQIENIFAFDCTGRQLDGVQLFDQQGRPITTLNSELGPGAGPLTGWDEERQQNIRYERHEMAGFAGMWNVFPLQEARANPDRDPSTAPAKEATWPMAETLPLSPNCVTAVEGTGEEGAAAGASAADTSTDLAARPEAGDATESGAAETSAP